MRRIIYTSRSLVPGDAAALDAIVGGAIAWNTRVDVTGMLWSDGANFAQVIEGDHDEVGTVMDRIRADPRHTDIVVVLDRAVTVRQFGNWSMRCADDGQGSLAETTFLIGVALNDGSARSKRLYDIVVASEACN